MYDKCYVAIDLKSFFASVECVRLNKDPLNTNLVVADESKTDKTICLAITPSLKEYKISGRPRLYEVKSKIEKLNDIRLSKIPTKTFEKSSFLKSEIEENKNVKIDFLISPPHMKEYIKYSTLIYEIYLEFVSKEDIYVYSIDEVFIDITPYLKMYNKRAYDFTKMILERILEKTNITATAGIGTNLYLAKVAMDILAKKKSLSYDNVRIAMLTETSYKKLLWDHRPISDFWRIGKGYQRTLENNNMYTMGDVAICAIENEDLLYRLFGLNAELLIDHAFGIEPISIKDIKGYKRKTHSINRSQVLKREYNFEECELLIKEMIDSISLYLFSKNLCTNKLVLELSHGAKNLENNYFLERKLDVYGREVPKDTRINIKLDNFTNSEKKIREYVIKEYKTNAIKNLTVNKINISICNLENVNNVLVQLDIFSENKKKEENVRSAILKVKEKYGKNAILKANNLEKESTAKIRNESIGGHSE